MGAGILPDAVGWPFAVPELPHDHAHRRNRRARPGHALVAPSPARASGDGVRGEGDERVRRRQAPLVRPRRTHGNRRHRRGRRPAQRQFRPMPSACAPISTPCPSTRSPAWRTHRKTRARCTRAATTATPRCCSAPRARWRSGATSTAPPYFIFQPAEENEGGGRVMVAEGLFDRFPDEGRVRHAQLARAAGRQDRAARKGR